MTAPSLGDLLYLASYVIRVRVSACSTPPDTPNQYTANLHVMGDQGAMVLDALAGPPGPGGLQDFAFRQQDDAGVNSSADLPTNLTDTPADIGKYWLIDTLDAQGVVTAETAWTWYGTNWQQFQMGLVGPPGPVPAIQISEQLIDPGADAYVDTSATTIEPSWVLHLPEPAGPTGPIGPLYHFPDIDTTTKPVAGDLMTATGKYTTTGHMIWAGQPFATPLPGPYSMPESAFTAYTGVTQQALIGSFTIPTQTFAYTPIVWGHIGMGGANLSGDPLQIGAQILLNNATTGVQIARGMGTTLGRVAIMPHYSTATKPSAGITPTNQHAIVASGQTATVYVNLWNDGQLGAYTFTPGGAQLFILASPLNPGAD